MLFVLKDHPDDAGWLTEAEKKWLDAELQRDRDEGGATSRHDLKDAFKLPMVWLLAVVYMLSQVGVYTVNIWMPKILDGFVHVERAGGGGAGGSVWCDSVSGGGDLHGGGGLVERSDRRAARFILRAAW